MIVKLSFRPNDQRRINHIFREPMSYPLKQPTVERLLGVWDRFIISLVPGYKGSIYGYVYWLEMRNLLERITSQLSSEGQAELIKHLGPLDKQYEKATLAIEQPIRGNYPQGFWWWYRVPSKFQESRDLQLFPSLTFDLQDTERIQQKMMLLSKIAPLEYRLDALLSKWVRFVVQIKHGYTLDLYSYQNSLHSRSVLADIYRELSDKGKEELEIVLCSSDTLFKSHTTPITSASSPLSGELDPSLSWLNRMPTQISEALKKEFAESRIFPQE